MSYRFTDSLRAGSERNSVWHIPLLCVQRKTSDDGQRNCPKHVEFYSKNKFEKLVYLVGFIMRIFHDARSPERQISFKFAVKRDKHVTHAYEKYPVNHVHDSLYMQQHHSNISCGWWKNQLYSTYINNNNNNNNNRRYWKPYTLRHQDTSLLLTRRHRQIFLQNSVPISKFHSKSF